MELNEVKKAQRRRKGKKAIKKLKNKINLKLERAKIIAAQKKLRAQETMAETFLRLSAPKLFKEPNCF